MCRYYYINTTYAVRSGLDRRRRRRRVAEAAAADRPRGVLQRQPQQRARGFRDDGAPPNRFRTKHCVAGSKPV